MNGLICFGLSHSLDKTIMPSTSSNPTAHAFNKLLNQPKAASKSKSGEVDDGTKRLRRVILVDGIPSSAVRPHAF